MKLMKKRITKRYSEAFKRQVVCEYEDGFSVQDLRRKYGITGNGTIERWVRQYANAGLRQELITIQRAAERERERQLQQRVRELEAAVSQLTLEKIVLESTVAEAEKLLGQEVKKNDARPSSKSVSNTH
jgi:transposase-like protein